MASTMMKPLRGPTTELLASRVLASHCVPFADSCAHNSSAFTFRERKLHRILIAPVLSAEHFGVYRAARAGAPSSASYRRCAVFQSLEGGTVVDELRGENEFIPENKLDAPFSTDAAQLISGVETFHFDCDGVIWKDDKLIDGGRETLDQLRPLAGAGADVGAAKLDVAGSAAESRPSSVLLPEYRKQESGMRGIAEVIGNARQLEYAPETRRDRELSGSDNGESLLDWKADERIRRSCEAGPSLRVAVLVSGGVDSSVALRLLCDAGHSCTGFYLKIWFQEDFENFWSSCPWEEDLSFAQAVCDEADVELKVVHLTDAYWGKVVSESISAISAGRTPNPDMLCNSRIKFGEFLKHIKDEQFDRVASGHYARVKRAVSGSGEQLTQLHLSADEAKDQTYFLSQLSQSQLSRLMFPLGELTKVEVRQVAEAMGLANKQRKDSQGICFLGKVKFSEFIARNLGEREGCLLEAETGELLGTHKGFWFYTIGQRQGIGLSNGPWFVVAKDVDHNVIFVSRKYFTEKKRRTFRASSFNWASGSRPSSLGSLRCKVRHGPRFYECTMSFNASGQMERICAEENERLGDENCSTAVVHLAEDDQGLAPGQYAAFYQDGLCLGSGIIFEAFGAEEKALNVSVQALEAAKLCSNPEFFTNRNGAKKTSSAAVVGSTVQKKSCRSKSSKAGSKSGEEDTKSGRSTGLPTEIRSKPSDANVWPLSLLSRFFSWLQSRKP